MLIRDTTPKSSDEWYENARLTNPGLYETGAEHLGRSIATPFALAADLNKTFASTDFGKSMTDLYDSVSKFNDSLTEGYTQQATDYIGDILGFGLNPITRGLGSLGGMAAGKLVGEAAPEAIGALTRKPLSQFTQDDLKVVGQETLKNLGTLEGGALPQSIKDNYDRDADHINWLGTAQEMGQMGAIGIGISSIPFLWGALRGKINSARGKSTGDATFTADLNKALEDKAITPEEHQWMTDYNTKDLSDPVVRDQLEKDATQILAKDKYDVNATNNQVPFEIYSSKAMENLKSILPDQLATDMPEDIKDSLSKFVTNNEMDGLQAPEKMRMLEGLKGYVDFIEDKISKKPGKLAESDKILDDHLLKSLPDDSSFSQKEMFKNANKQKMAASELKNLPHVIPDNIIKRTKQLAKAKDLNNKSKTYFKEYERTGDKEYVDKMKEVDLQVKEIESNLEPILTPKEELMQLRKSLLSEKGIPANYQFSKDYQRLMDLSNVWHNARTLLDRIHLEDDYKKQESFKNLIKGVTQIMEAPIEKLAKPDNVVDYLKARISKNMYKEAPITNVESKMKSAKELPSDINSTVDEYREQVEKSKSDKLKDEFENADNKLTQFKESESIFKNFISCVMGTLNG